MTKNRINQEMVEEVLPTGTTADSNPYEYGKVEAKKTEKKLYTLAEMDEAVKAENEACAKLLEEKSARAWDIFKRSDDHTKRGNKYYEGISDGMDEISELIRARIK